MCPIFYLFNNLNLYALSVGLLWVLISHNDNVACIYFLRFTRMQTSEKITICLQSCKPEIVLKRRCKNTLSMHDGRLWPQWTYRQGVNIPERPVILQSLLSLLRVNNCFCGTTIMHWRFTGNAILQLLNIYYGVEYYWSSNVYYWPKFFACFFWWCIQLLLIYVFNLFAGLIFFREVNILLDIYFC